MANTIVTLRSSDSGDLPRLIFTSAGNFSLGTDFADLYKVRSFDSLNFESVGMTTDGAKVKITNTSGKAFEFLAMPEASMTGVETAVTTAFGVAIVGANQIEWTEQLHALIDGVLNQRRTQI